MTFKNRNDKRFGQKGSARRPATARPAEAPMLLPPLEERRPSAVFGDPAVDAHQPTLAVPSGEVEARSGQLFKSEVPTVARPIQAPAVQEQPPTVQTKVEQPSAILSALVDYRTRFQRLQSSNGPELMQQVGALLQDLQKLRRENTDKASREELEQVNDFIGKVHQKMMQLMEMMRVQSLRAQAELEPPPPPIQIDLPPQVPSSQQNPLPAEVSVRALQPSLPVQSAPQEQQEAAPGAIKRAIASPMTWAISMVSAFTAVLVQQHAFKDIAQMAGRLFKSEPPSEKMTSIVYGAVVVATLAVTSLVNMLRNRSAERKEAQEMRRENEGPTDMGQGMR
ncbi:MAG: hypothetical protein AB1295_00565 [Candidatus Micrarchaeota archaeon]